MFMDFLIGQNEMIMVVMEKEPVVVVVEEEGMVMLVAIKKVVEFVFFVLLDLIFMNLEGSVWGAAQQREKIVCVSNGGE